MRSGSYQAVIFFLLVFLSAVAEQTGLLTIFGIKPSLVLTVAAVCTLFAQNFANYGWLLFFSLICVRFTPGVSREVIGLLIAMLVIFWLKERVVRVATGATLIMVSVATLINTLIVAPDFLYAHPIIVVKEIIYNGCIGLMLAAALRRLYEARSSIR
jgi:hypothetical protein